MERKLVEEQLIKIMSERLEVSREAIKPESKLRDDLGIDSFGLVELSFEIKDKFGIKVEDSDLGAIKIFNDAVDYICKKTKE